MVDWSDSFWGEGNRGFEILLSNIKNGPIAIEEFQRFLTENAQCESTYYKNLSRLQSQFLKSQYVGTFTPIWNLMRHLLDKVCSTHLSTMNLYQDLLRDIHNYQDLYQKKIKGQIQKDGDIVRTPDLIVQLNNSLNTVNKAKEQYYSIALEYERAKRSGNNSSNMSSALTTQDTHSPSLAQSAMNSLASRHTERLERKYRQAQDEYKLTIEKYNMVRNDYEKRFSDASSKFQAFEIDHIEKMLAFSLSYSEILQRNSDQIRTAQNEFNNKLKLLTGNELLDLFIEQKKTGTDRPGVLQFEEVDNLKSSISLSSELPMTQEDPNLSNQQDFNVPSFQTHFSVSSPGTKQTDISRGLGAHSPSNDSNMSPANNNSTSVTSMPSNSLLTRLQEGNEQTSNPFDVIIRKSKFPAIFGSKRPPKDKKVDKKLSTDNKSRKIPHIRRPHNETNESNLQNTNSESTDFKSMVDNNEDFAHPSSNKLNTRSSSSISNDDTNHRHNEGRHPFPSSKSSSQSDTSDDDDDNPMTKIFVKINQPKTQVPSDEDDEMKISSAMRLVDLNMGNFAPNSRALSSRTSDVNKPLSGGPIGTRLLPPIPSSSAPTNTVDPSSMFPSHDEFSPSPFNAINIPLNNQENRSTSSQSRSESKNTTSLSSNEDDREVASSFPNNDSINKTTMFPILQVPRSFQLNRQPPPPTTTSPMSPSTFSSNPSFNNSPSISNEMGTSPLTIGAMEQIPLAIAFQETIHVMMSGDNQENWKSRITGQMLISFPSSILNLFADSSRAANTLEFRVKNLDNIENIIAKPGLIIQNESSTDSNELIYSFDMTELNNTLRNLQEKNSSSLFFNLNVLNYQLKQFDVSNIPIEISSQWTRTFDTISVNIKYHFNCSSLPESIRFTNNSVIIYTVITDGQQIKESSPMAEWSETEHKLLWKVPYVNNGTGNLSASVRIMEMNKSENADEEEPWTTSSIVKASFIGENALFSSVDFDLIGRSYRISLLKKKILSGKYQSEPDQSEPISFFKRPTKSSVTDKSLNPSDI